MQALQVFNYNQMPVRTVTLHDDPWFVAKDVCGILSINNSRMALNRLDNDEKSTVNLNTVSQTDTIQRGNPNVSVVNESGLYALILRSDKPEAKPFRKWITSEVLPQIRKTGSYNAEAAPVNTTIPTFRYVQLLEAENEQLRFGAAIDPTEELAPEVEVLPPQTDSNIFHERFMQLFGKKMSVRQFVQAFDLPISRQTANNVIYYGGNLPNGSKVSAAVVSTVMKALRFTDDEIRAEAAKYPRSGIVIPLLGEPRSQLMLDYKTEESISMEEKLRKKRNSSIPKPGSIEEARKMARIRAVDAAPLWGMGESQLRGYCIRGEIPGAHQKTTRSPWYVTPDGMDAFFNAPKKRQHRR